MYNQENLAKEKMRRITIVIVLFLGMIVNSASAQQVSAKMMDPKVLQALQQDDLAGFKRVFDQKTISECYDEDHVLVWSVRLNAAKCFDYLLNECRPDLNLVCGGGKAPLYLATKYGRLEMVKALVKKGADLQLKYRGEDLLAYAERYGQQEIIAYLKSLAPEKKKLPVVKIHVD